MGSTSLAIPYADPTDSPNIAVISQNLAAAVDALLQARSVPKAAQSRVRSSNFTVPTASPLLVGTFDVPAHYNAGDWVYSSGVYTAGPSWGSGGLCEIRVTWLMLNGTQGPGQYYSGSSGPTVPAGGWTRWMYVSLNGAAFGSTSPELQYSEVISEALGFGVGALFKAVFTTNIQAGDTLQLGMYHTYGQTLQWTPSQFIVNRIA